jgi:hypothetical protein
MVVKSARLFFEKLVAEDRHMNWKCTMMAKAIYISKGCWPRFAKDHDLHPGWFLIFNYHCGTSKFDVQIFDGIQCQKKYGPTLK